MQNSVASELCEFIKKNVYINVFAIYPSLWTALSPTLLRGTAVLKLSQHYIVI